VTSAQQPTFSSADTSSMFVAHQLSFAITSLSSAALEKQNKVIPQQVQVKTKVNIFAGTIGLGEWDVYQGIRMRTTETDFPKWTLNILLPVGSEFEYKYVIMRANGSVEWEQCEHNRKISSAEYVYSRDFGAKKPFDCFFQVHFDLDR
jgi:hypothetical protein